MARMASQRLPWQFVLPSPLEGHRRIFGRCRHQADHNEAGCVCPNFRGYFHHGFEPGDCELRHTGEDPNTPPLDSRQQKRFTRWHPPMKIECPYPDCAQHIEIEECHAGTTAACPTCNRQFQCPPLQAFESELTKLAKKKPRRVTPKQAALLTYLGIPVPATKDEASDAIDAAIESDAYAERLSGWQQDRLKLHPDLYAMQIEEQRHSRAETLCDFVNCDVGSEFHPIKRITFRQATAAVQFLDQEFPGWDAKLWEEFGPSVDVAWDWFIPAVALTAPQAVKKAWQGTFSLPPGKKQVTMPRRGSGCFAVVVLLLAIVGAFALH